jgi:cbb3-type cytochrome oxidase subunit 3
MIEDAFFISDLELIGYMFLFSIGFLAWMWWSGK